MAKRNPGEDMMPYSLNVNFGEDEDLQLLDIIIEPSNFVEEIQSDAEVIEMIYKFKSFIAILNDTQKIVYLHSVKGMTLQASGDIIGVSRERIRQIRNKIDEKVYLLFHRKVKIDMTEAYKFSAELLSKKSDDQLMEDLNCDLAIIKICREILNIANLYDTTNV